MIKIYETTDNLLWFMYPFHNNSLESFKSLKNLIVSAFGSHCIHNHTPITIIIIIFSSMYIARIRSLLNHPFYYGLVRNTWFSICKSTQVFFHEPFLKKIYHNNIWIDKLFIFTSFTWTSNIALINNSWIK
jgi:hypothetical protein